MAQMSPEKLEEMRKALEAMTKALEPFDPVVGLMALTFFLVGAVQHTFQKATTYDAILMTIERLKILSGDFKDVDEFLDRLH